MPGDLELNRAGPSAVIVIEAGSYFWLENRPNLPEALAHPGMTQLFGGHIDRYRGFDRESAIGAVRREVLEELGINLPLDPLLKWCGETLSRNSKGRLVRRRVNLFWINLGTEIEPPVDSFSELVRVEKTAEGVEEVTNRLTRFAYTALRCTLAEDWGEMSRWTR